MSESLLHTILTKCYCGAVALCSEADARGIVHCHCGQCRRLSGNAFTTWVSLQKRAVHVAGAENIAVFNVTSNVARHFCKVCGSHAYTTDNRYPEILGVAAGSVEGSLPAMPKAHYFVSHKAAWHTISDTLPQFGGKSGFEPTAV